MGMIVQHNMNAINAYNRLNANVAGLKKASEKLASGYRINRAGDDAAGLAISEKMRSQIRGLNQAVRNSQDGINMIQTFEGAAQETHNILQRMKELAVESANGTYDNATDRAAIELEFQQLNDELNQIADTDFNGTIVLNGGEMADGLKQENGEFNYANLDGQIADAIAKLEAKKAALLAAQPKDIGAEYMDALTDLNDNTYTDQVAKDLWKDLGLDTDKVKSIDLQFQATKDPDTGVVSYKAVALKAYGVDDEGNEIELDLEADLGIDADKLKAALDKITATATAQTGATGYGGFSFKGTTNTADIANAVFDATKVESGDMINFHLTGPSATAKAPTNAAIADAYGGENGDLDNVELDNGTVITKPSVTLNTTNLTDANMTQEIYDILKALDGAEFTFTNDQGNAAAGAVLGDGKISINGNAITTGNAYVIGKDSKGNDLEAYFTLSNGKLTISTKLANGGKGTDLLTIDTGKYAGDGKADGTGKFKLVLDSYFFPEAGAGPDVNVVEADLSKFSVDDQIAEIDDQIAALQNGDPNASTIANAFKNSTARMTYADHIILQTGARTKDAVDFTFNYNTDGSADMGALLANLNLSSRADGLNTANLTLANQKDANYAIDQIDKAINKTSMVRATFGAIQNRLEHKITNLTTTSENLTEAESSIRDTDMAQEMMNYTKFNILQQAAQSMLAQANQQPQSILQLLG